MTTVALLSNPLSTGNRSLLPQVRCYCAENPDIFHYEVEEVSQIARALETIAEVQPRVIVINGGDGTVQAALTELYHGGHFGDNPPPVAVLPNGKTNLIALDLGAEGNPIAALEKITHIAKTDLESHLVQRQLIALSDGSEHSRPVLGMFLGGGGLAETILFCRHKIYPLGLPNGVSHFITGMVTILSYLLGLKAKFLPRPAPALSVSLIRQGQIRGKFVVLIVTTLDKLLLHQQAGGERDGRLKLLAIDQRPAVMLRALWASLTGRLVSKKLEGVHVESGDIIRIEGPRSSVILDGELFEASEGHPIILQSTAPVPFLKLAA